MIGPVLRFFVPGKPKSTQTGSVWRTGGGRAVPSRMNEGWSRDAKVCAMLAMREANLPLFEGPVALAVTLIMPRLKDMKKQGPYPNGGPDLDNAVKGPKDSWQGVLYANDRQIKKLTLEVVWAAENIREQAGGGLSVSIYALA